jgi:hypothetical protein
VTVREPLKQVLRKAAAALPAFAGQVAVSVAAILSAAFLAQLVLNTKPRPTPSPPAVSAALTMLDPRVGTGLLRGQFSETGYRLRPGYPTEFGAVFGPAPGRPYRALAAAEWSGAPAAAPAAEKPAAQPCGEACKRKVVAAAVLPPTRPASLGMPMPDAAPAIVAAALQDERVRLLGMRLPGFVPSGERVVKTVASWGGAVSGLIDGMR